MNRTDNPDDSARTQFEEAARRLAAAEARLRALSANPLADENARQSALDVYEEARLFWLSCEAVLRSAEIVDDPKQHPGKSVAILRGDPHIAESIALLLRLRGFRTTVLLKTHIDDTALHGPAAAVIVDVERDWDKAYLSAIHKLNANPSTRFIAMIPPALAHHDWSGFHTVLTKPASIDSIVQAIISEAGPRAAT